MPQSERAVSSAASRSVAVTGLRGREPAEDVGRAAEPPGGGGSAVLARAVARAVARSASAEAGVGVGFSAEVVRDIVRMVEEAGESHGGGPALPRTAHLGEHRAALEALREELLALGAGPSEDAAPPVVLALLRRLESVRRVLAADDGARFADRLSGPDAMELLAEIAHDLRSPLTAILTLAESLRNGQSGPVNETQRRQLGLVYSAALGLSGVASDLIELARGGDRLADREPVPFSVSEVFRSVVDIVQPMAEEKGLDLCLSLPAPDERVGYPLALSRVLLNLTTNSLKFTHEGVVELGAREVDAARVEFWVRDTGPGIPEPALRRLYEPFRRCGTGRPICFSGSGLGLAICRRLVQAMGGELRVESRLGEGTRFSFELCVPPVCSAWAGGEGGDAAAVGPRPASDPGHRRQNSGWKRTSTV